MMKTNVTILKHVQTVLTKSAASSGLAFSGGFTISVVLHVLIYGCSES